MIIYKTYHGSGATYSLSYRELRERVQEFVDMTDEKFLESLPEAAHLACIVSWVKELGIDETVGDEGVVHQIMHLMTCPTTVDLHRFRDDFKRILALA